MPGSTRGSDRHIDADARAPGSRLPVPMRKLPVPKRSVQSPSGGSNRPARSIKRTLRPRGDSPQGTKGAEPLDSGRRPRKVPKIWMGRHRRTPPGRGDGMVRRWIRNWEALPGPGEAAYAGGVQAYDRPNAKLLEAGGPSDGVVVPMMAGHHKPAEGRTPAPSHACNPVRRSTHGRGQ